MISVSMIFQAMSHHKQDVDEFLENCNRSVESLLQRYKSHMLLHLKEISRNAWLNFPRLVFLTQKGLPAQQGFIPSKHLEQFLAWLQVEKAHDVFSTVTDIRR